MQLNKSLEQADILTILMSHDETICYSRSVHPQVRIQTSLLARRERVLLDWFCAHLPNGITPDRLTLTGVLGAFIVFAGYIGSRYNPACLWLATLGYCINWFGDSLDGSLARYRGIDRPRYGYFLDHSADAFAIVLIMVGLGLSGYVRLDAALFALLGYLMLCIYVFLCNHVTGRFQLTFMALGPTELRIGLIALNTLMYFDCGTKFSVGSETISSFDIILVADGVITIVLAIVNMLKVINELKLQEPAVESQNLKKPFRYSAMTSHYKLGIRCVERDQSLLKNSSTFRK